MGFPLAAFELIAGDLDLAVFGFFVDRVKSCCSPLQIVRALDWLYGDWNEGWIWLQLQSVLKISVSFCSVSFWPIPDSSFPAVTTVYTVSKDSWNGMEMVLAQSLRKAGYFYFTAQERILYFGKQAAKDLSFLVGCIAGICHVEATVPHTRAQDRSAVCANGRNCVLGSRERLSHGQLCTTCHPGHCQWVTHSLGSCTVNFVILLFLLHFAWGKMWSESYFTVTEYDTYCSMDLQSELTFYARGNT